MPRRRLESGPFLVSMHRSGERPGRSSGAMYHATGVSLENPEGAVRDFLFVPLRFSLPFVAIVLIAFTYKDRVCYTVVSGWVPRPEIPPATALLSKGSYSRHPIE